MYKYSKCQCMLSVQWHCGKASSKLGVILLIIQYKHTVLDTFSPYNASITVDPHCKVRETKKYIFALKSHKTITPLMIIFDISIK